MLLVGLYDLFHFVTKFVHQELEDNWPQFGEVSRTRSCGAIQSRYIYHLAIAKYRNPQSIEVIMGCCKTVSFICEY